MNFFKPLGIALLLAVFAGAAPIQSSAVASAGNVTRNAQLEEIGDIIEPGAMAYVSVGTYWFPHPRQTALRSEYGIHDGYAFRQRLGGYFAAPFNEFDPDWALGFLWFAERHGFDSEDFLFWPYYGKFSLVRSVQTAGAALSSKKLGLGVVGGIQYSNPEVVSRNIYAAETDSLYGFGRVFWGPLGVQGSFGDHGWKYAMASLHLESKELNGGVSRGILTYLPNVNVSLYRHAMDSTRVTWEQNLYGQMLYGEVTAFVGGYGFYSAALKYYPDPSRIASFDFTCFRDSDDEYHFGGGLNIFMLRLAYNHAYDHENLFGTKRSFVVELNLSIGAKDGIFYGKKAAKPAPVQETDLKPLDRKSSSNAIGKTNDEGVKEITAKGIRREKK